MRNLFQFLRKYYFVFLFLLLEALSLTLFFNYNEFQGNVMYMATYSLSGSIDNLFRNISEYFSLRKTNRILVEELAKFYKPDSVTGFVLDSLSGTEFRYIGARVISNSTNKRNNFLMINKGKLHGIKNHMGVIIGNKIVGQVVSVSPHFSWIMSVLHKDSRISAKFKKNNQLVTVEWPGGNYKIGEVKEIPRHVAIIKGDSIITSGNSEIFPEGILIGTIEDYTVVEDENFNYATILFSTDFNSLGYVEVVVDLMRKEKEDLKNSFKAQQ
jgi:rod shape-determining protein MreC